MMDRTRNHERGIRGKGFSLFAALCLVVMIAPCISFAATSYPTKEELPDSCDVTFMTKMTDRASAEAARDTVLAQTAIRKADSVLEYSCFGQMAGIAANVGAKLFTETTYWKSGAGSKVDISSYDEHHSPGPVIVKLNIYQPIGTVGSALGDIVFSALSQYAKSNFGHSYLGIAGSSSAPTPSGSGYNCSDMQIVWHMSKCDPFLSKDFFTKIGQSEDIRKFPQACTAGTGFAGVEDKIKNNFSAPKTMDRVLTHLKKLHREAPEVQACAQQKPIATGRMVEKIKSFSKPATGSGHREVLTKAEKICLLPGCYYDYESDKCAEE